MYCQYYTERARKNGQLLIRNYMFLSLLFGADGGSLSLLEHFRITSLYPDCPPLPQKVERSAPVVCAPELKFRTLAPHGFSSNTQFSKKTPCWVFFFREPTVGVEPTTYGLRYQCSTN